MYKKQILGKAGEMLVSKYLKKNEYYIYEENFRCSFGEIDIIAYDSHTNEIVFIEVKTRTNFNYGFPSEAVNKVKKQHIIQTAKYYLYLKKFEKLSVRLDVIEVVVNENNYKINHIKQAF